MKKIFTLFVGALLSLSAHAVDYTFNWATSIEGVSADIVGFAKSTDGKYFLGLNWGGKSATSNPISWGGVNLKDAQGADINGASIYSGNSTALNFLLTKFDASGQPLWKVYSNYGTISSSSCNVVATKDGGAVALIAIRSTVEPTSQLASLVDATGKTVVLQTSDADVQSFRSVLVKVSANGAIEWTRTISSYDFVAGKDKSTTVGVAVNDIALDASGNIYVGGTIRTEAYFIGAYGKQVVTVGGNTSTWDGTTQTQGGKAFIAKLDSAGYYKNVYVDPTNTVYTSVGNLAISEGKLYGIGVGKGGTTIDANLYKIDLSAENFEATVVNYAGQLNTASKQNLQIKKLQVIDGKLYVSGALIGNILKGESAVATGDAASTKLAGFIARLDLDGNPEKSLVIPGSQITSFQGIAKAGNYLFASAYDFANGAQLYAIPYDFQALPSPTVMALSGTTTVLAAPVIEGDKLVYVTRAGKSSASNVKFYGTTAVKPALANGYGVLLGSWTITGASLGVKELKAEQGKQSAYTISGVKQNADNLSRGLYVVGGNKVAVK